MSNATPTSPVEVSHELQHFLRLMRVGKLRGACGGSRAARDLAKAAVSHAPDLDGQAIQGFIEFLRFAKARPESARNVLES